MPLKASFKKKLISLLRKFKLPEFSVLLPSVFPKISADKVISVLEELKLRPTPISAAEVVVYLFEQHAPSIDDCDNILCQIHTLDASFHHHLTWVAAKLKNEVNELPEKLKDLNNAIKRSYRTKALNVNVHSIYYDNIIWSVIMERIILKKGGIRLGTPMYFAFKPELVTPHLLFSPPTINRDFHLRIYLESLGFEGYELMNYEGCRPSSLIDCIQKKLTNETSLVPQPSFEMGTVAVKRGEGFEDYSRAMERTQFARQIFSNGSHKQVTLECEQLCLNRVNASSVSEFYSTAHIKAKGSVSSVEEIFQYLVTIGAVHLPLPSYMLSIRATPSNIISVQD